MCPEKPEELSQAMKNAGAMAQKRGKYGKRTEKDTGGKDCGQGGVDRGSTARIESEKQELAEMYKEKRNIQLENIDNMLEEWALSPQEAEEALRRYVDQREEAV